MALLLYRIVDLLVIDAVIQLAIVIEFVLAIDLATEAAQAQDDVLLAEHGFYFLLEDLDVFALS